MAEQHASANIKCRAAAAPPATRLPAPSATTHSAAAPCSSSQVRTCRMLRRTMAEDCFRSLLMNKATAATPAAAGRVPPGRGGEEVSAAAGGRRRQRR